MKLNENEQRKLSNTILHKHLSNFVDECNSIGVDGKMRVSALVREGVAAMILALYGVDSDMERTIKESKEIVETTAKLIERNLKNRDTTIKA